LDGITAQNISADIMNRSHTTYFHPIAKPQAGSRNRVE
jgi:hypothetical protein